MRDYYFGKEMYEEYGKEVQEKLHGKTISKRIDTAEEVGGIKYEAEKLGMDLYDLIETLEGMCYNGKAKENYPGDSYTVF